MKLPKKPKKIMIGETDELLRVYGKGYNKACDDWETYLKILISSNPAEIERGTR